MLDSKKTNFLLALAGAAVLMASSPALAQDAAPAPAETTAEASAAAETAPSADTPRKPRLRPTPPPMIPNRSAANLTAA
jgi:nitrate reductase cytochrome c-type subunit